MRGGALTTPIAIVILTGLITSVVLNMLFVPTPTLRFGSSRTLSAPRDQTHAETVAARGS